MDLFNDIDFNDDNDILTSSILSNDVEEIAKLFVKNIDWMKVSYEIYEHYVIMIDAESYCDSFKDKIYKTIDGDSLPYNPDSICVIFKFNETYAQIEYIQVYPYLYSINRHIINDDDFYIIKFANILYDNYSIITQKIIYGFEQITYNNIKERFGLSYNKNWQLSNDDYKVSNGFATNFPKLLNINQINIARIVYIRKISIQDESTFISLLNSLLKQFNKIILDVSTTYIDNIPIYKYDTKNLQFFNVLTTNFETTKIGEENIIITRDIINKLSKLNLMEKMNKKKCQQTFFDRLKDKNILKENINQNHLYKSLVESIAISVKKSINEDKYDYGHHAPSSHLKQRIQRVLTNKFGYASLREVSRRIGNRDFYIANRTNVPNYPSKFEIAVVERSKKNEDNFRIPISRKGEMDILSDDNIKYVLFPRYIGTSNIDYIVYILDKDDIKEIYDKLKSILDRCKEEIKQGKRDRKTIKVNKSISDKWKNFLAPTPGADGVCLSNNCLKELAVDTFKLYYKNY